MRFAVFDETTDGETRVALVPDAVKMLLKKQHAVSVQCGAGRAASIPDAQFAAAGAQMVADAAELARHRGLPVARARGDAGRRRRAFPKARR